MTPSIALALQRGEHMALERCEPGDGVRLGVTRQIVSPGWISSSAITSTRREVEQGGRRGLGPDLVVVAEQRRDGRRLRRRAPWSAGAGVDVRAAAGRPRPQPRRRARRRPRPPAATSSRE